ncbi:MAG TPA: hypothetical protein VM115_09995 [Vicinamibacterales bacterium]|nr:hypothetical protein [Vicinamibacterales bacterium]
MIIKRIGPLSVAKLSAVLYAVMGLILGGVFSLVGLAGGFASETEGAAGIGAMLGVAAIIVFPIFYGLMGFVLTLFAAWLYNFAAGFVGGVEVDIQ